MSAIAAAVARVRRPDDEPDGRLLDRFRRHADHPAFEHLVRRHGGMVLGVCRRITRNPADADDAFQAVFLVLARKAGELTDRATVGNWLYGVAVHTARKANAMAARRRLKEAAAARPTPPDDPDWRPLFDQALAALPDKYREPLVLHELDGLTRKQVAGHLGIPEGTLSSRLATAKRMLADRLTRLGLPATAVTAAVVTPELLANTMRAVGGAATATASTLAREVATMMLVNGLRTKAVIGLAALAVIAAGLAAVPRTPAEEPARPVDRAAEWKKFTDAEAAERKALQGTWVVEKHTQDGTDVPADKTEQVKPDMKVVTYTWVGMTWTFADRKMVRVQRPGHPEMGQPSELSFVVNPHLKPAELTLFGGAGALLQTVYKRDGDRLTVAMFGAAEYERPGGFTTKEDLTYRSEKAKLALRGVPDGGPVFQLEYVAPASPLNTLVFKKQPPKAAGEPDRKQASAAPPAAEPAWKADFRREYGLADGQAVRVVPIKEVPAEPPGRVAAAKKFDPAALDQARAVQRQHRLFRQDGDAIRVAGSITRSVTFAGDRPVRAEGLRLSDLMSLVLRVPPQELEGDPAVWAARADVDVVLRADAKPEDVVAQLGPELEKACGLKVRFRITTEVREVVVARGTFKSTPLDGRKANDVEIYENVLKPDADIARNRFDLDGMLNRLGTVTNQRVVNLATPLPAGTWLSVGDHVTRDDRPADAARILGQVAAQTGLTFVTEKRQARVLTGTLAE